MPDVVSILKNKFPESILMVQPTKDEFPSLWIKADDIVELLSFLKTAIDQPYRMLYDLTAIDEQARNYRSNQPESKFTVVYQLLSFERNTFLRLKVALPLQLDIPSIPGA